MSRLSDRIGVNTYGWTGDGADLKWVAKQWLREHRPAIFTARDIELAQSGVSELRDAFERQKLNTEKAERQYRDIVARKAAVEADLRNAQRNLTQIRDELSIVAAALGTPDAPDDPDAPATVSLHDVVWEWDLTNKRWVAKSNLTKAATS